MTTFNLTLLVAGLDKDHLDDLYEASGGGANVEMGDRWTSAVGFDLDAHSFAAAVIEAIDQVERVSGLTVVRVEPDGQVPPWVHGRDRQPSLEGQSQQGARELRRLLQERPTVCVGGKPAPGHVERSPWNVPQAADLVAETQRPASQQARRPQYSCPDLASPRACRKGGAGQRSPA